MRFQNDSKIARFGIDRLPSRKPPVPADTIRTERLEVERKTFVFQLQENARGRFLRITEEAHGRKNAIVVPAPGLTDFARLLGAVSEAGPNAPE